MLARPLEDESKEFEWQAVKRKLASVLPAFEAKGIGATLVGAVAPQTGYIFAQCIDSKVANKFYYRHLVEQPVARSLLLSLHACRPERFELYAGCAAKANVFLG